MRAYRPVGFITDKREAKGNQEALFEIAIITYDEKKYECSANKVVVGRTILLNALRDGKSLQLLNGKVTSDNKIIWYIPKMDKDHAKDTILDLSKKIRSYLEYNYGTNTDLCGECIRASTMLVFAFNFCGYHNCKTVEGWCEYDDDSSCSDRPYDEHTWVELEGGKIYLDITAGQFNTCMYRENEYGSIVFCKGLPHGMCYDEPDGWSEDDEEIEPEEGWDE